MIALDTTSTGGGGSAVSSFSWSHTCTGSNLVLLVAVYAAAFSGATITGVTYNSVAMTALYNDGTPVPSAGNYLAVFYMLNPPTGAHTVAVSLSSSSSFPDAIAASYTGVKQSAFPDASKENGQNSGTTVSDSLTTVTPGSLVVMFATTAAAGATAGASTTLRQASSGTTNYWFEATAVTTPAGSQTLNANVTNGVTGWAMIALTDVSPPATATFTYPVNIRQAVNRSNTY